jgi:hypothetical protein
MQVTNKLIATCLCQGEVYMSRSFYVWTEDITNDAAWSMPIYVDEPGIDPDVSPRRD